MTSRHNIANFVVLTALASVAAPVMAGQFALQHPQNPRYQLLADVSPSRLIVTADAGTSRERKLVYLRYPAADTSYYDAYYRRQSQMIVRWPINGRGNVLQKTGSGPWQTLPHHIRAIAAPAPPIQVTRQIANAPLPPVTIELTNTHRETLIVSLVDRRNPNARPQEITIPAGSSVRRTVERDAGAIEQTELVAATGETLRVLTQRPIAPQSIYDLVVYEHRVVSTYIDRTGKDKLVAQRFRPRAQTYGARSIGVVSLPAGDQLSHATRINVYDEVRYQRNPGAVVHYRNPRVR